MKKVKKLNTQLPRKFQGIRLLSGSKLGELTEKIGTSSWKQGKKLWKERNEYDSTNGYDG